MVPGVEDGRKDLNNYALRSVFGMDVLRRCVLA
jgi:hypothetical protein